MRGLAPMTYKTPCTKEHVCKAKKKLQNKMLQI